MKEVVIATLLAIAALMTAASVTGLFRTRDAFARLHYMTPLSTLATFAVALALVIEQPSAAVIVKVTTVFVMTALSSPVTQHKIARAIWVRRQGGWKLPEDAG